MANLTESPVWEAGIYQLEEEDLVQGGAEGIDNVQGKQLGNRTLYLKQQIESAQDDMTAHLGAADPHGQYATELWVAAQIAALINAAPGALDTLNELAAAIGDDANFAATMTNLLALKAPLASPALTGSPTAPTPAQFDATTKLATMAALQRALGNFQGIVGVAANTVLVPAQVGSLVEITGGTGVVITLPSATGIGGASFAFYNNTSNAVTVNAAGGQNCNLGRSNLSGFKIQPGGNAHVITDGISWEVLGEAMLGYSSMFGSSLSNAGYKRLPDANSPTGYSILMWGKGTGNSAADFTVTFPVAFPNACRGVVACCDYSPGSASIGYVATNDPSTTGFTGRSSANLSTHWFAFGN